MSINYEALKLCPIYSPEVCPKVPRVNRMTVCDAEQFLAVDLYFHSRNIDGEQLEYFARTTLTSMDYAEWLKTYGIVFTSSAIITNVKRVTTDQYYINVHSTTLRLLEFAYTKEQALAQAIDKVEAFVKVEPSGFFVEKL